MVEAGILDGDVVIVDKRSYAENGEIVVALIGDEATVKTFYREKGRIRLQPENDAYTPIEITPESGAEFFGVVTYVIKKMAHQG